MKKIYRSIIAVFGLAFIISACTKLDEKLYDRIDARTFYKTTDEINAAMADVYSRINGVHIWLNHWQLQECSTDHGMCPWGDGNVYKQDQMHTLTSTHGPNHDVYVGTFQVIAAANSFLENVKLANPTNLALLEGEVQALRAWCYMDLIDLYGNIPIVTASHVDPANLPATAKRADVFNFIETELKAAIAKLPADKDVNRQAVYPRIVTKEAAEAFLVKLYLNAEIWSGTARWQDVVTTADLIINSGAYSIPSGYGDIWKTFAPDNNTVANNSEIIFALSRYATPNWDPSLGLWVSCLSIHGELKGVVRNGVSLGIDQSFWGGPSVLEETYDIYDSTDFRRGLILKGKFYDASGKLLIDIKPYTNIDIATFPDSKAGLSCIKYKPQPGTPSVFIGNDMILFRYADVLYSKAEALYRLNAGNKAAAEALITQVYTRNFVGGKSFTINSLDDILKERSREFLWETSYRTDLVRFGKFITMRTLWHITDDPAFRNLYPIPQSEIDSNPNLVQNPGYTN